MILNIETKDDFIRETESFISKFEMTQINKKSPYFKYFSDLKEYLNNFVRYESYVFLSLEYLHDLLKSIEYVYINVDKEKDFYCSSLPHHLAMLLKVDYQALDNDEEDNN